MSIAERARSPWHCNLGAHLYCCCCCFGPSAASEYSNTDWRRPEACSIDRSWLQLL